VLVAAVAAVVVGQANGSGAWGQSPGEFAADSDANLRVSGWAFAIWGPIYAGLLAFAVWQTLRRSDGRVTDLLGWPAALALSGIGLWIVAAAYDAEPATAVIIISSALALILPLWVGADRMRAATGLDRRLGVWPLSALAGWLTVASPVNVVTVLSGNGDLPSPALAWSLGAVAGVTLLALAVSRRIGTVFYALPIAWGLFGVAVAEWSRNPMLAWTAAAALAVCVIGGSALARRSVRATV
jgi:hypothetical protein